MWGCSDNTGECYNVFLVMNHHVLYHFDLNKGSLQNINWVGAPKRGKEILILKHLSGPIEMIFFDLLRGPEVRGGRGQMSLGQKPKYIFIYF